jgi:tripartite-type tricarboxylate transporter receptor subunit TctC
METGMAFREWTRAVGIAAVMSAATLAGAAQAQTAGDFYKGKTLRLIVGSGEASGVDVLGRIVGRHLADFIPGKPTVVVNNMAQPESIAAANHVYNVADKDGLTIGAGSAGLFSRAISQPNIRFDLDKMTWIANLYNATVIFWMRTDFPCQTIEALKTCKQPLKFGATARGSTGYGLVPELLKDAFGLNVDIIYGYKDSGINLAVEQNEVQASGGDLIGFMSGRPLQFMKEGKVKILVQVAGKKSPELEQYQVPWVMDLIPEERRSLFAMVNPIIDMARPYYAPPGIPADRTKVLRDAFAKMAKDNAFNEEVTRIARIRATHLGGEEMTPAIHAMLNQSPEVKEKIIGLLRSSAN